MSQSPRIRLGLSVAIVFAAPLVFLSWPVGINGGAVSEPSYQVQPTRSQDVKSESEKTKPNPVVDPSEPKAEAVGIPQVGENHEVFHQDRLKEYGRLNAKVLLRDAERMRKLEILEDPVFLKAMGEYLKTGGDGNLESHAIDLLLESRRFAQAELTEQILQDVIADQRIENPSLVMSERERLAETKAEVMYLWSSESEKAAELISRVLPGEVSQKLWQNVRTLQEHNTQASADIQNRYASTGSHLISKDGFKLGE